MANETIYEQKKKEQNDRRMNGKDIRKMRAWE
jgi:hypothetical protein